MLKNCLPEHRKRHGLTQAGLAEEIGVSRKTVNTIENKVFIPSTVVALKLARALQTDVHTLFQLED